MKVKKSEQVAEPRYPNYRQVWDYRTLMGAAAIGLTAVTGFSAPVRTAGVPVRNADKVAAEPGKPGADSAKDEAPARLKGDVAVEPRPPAPGSMPVVPRQPTNCAATVSYTVKEGDTLSGLAHRFLGSSNRWRDVAAANPGLKPDAIKAGQTILMPKSASVSTNEPVPPRLLGKPAMEPR